MNAVCLERGEVHLRGRDARDHPRIVAVDVATEVGVARKAAIDDILPAERRDDVPDRNVAIVDRGGKSEHRSSGYAGRTGVRPFGLEEGVSTPVNERAGITGVGVLGAYSGGFTGE